MTSDQAARMFLGVPFRHQGRDLTIGIDCIGFLVWWGTALGMGFVAHDRTDYGIDPSGGLLERYLEVAFGKPIAKGDMRAGDVPAIDYKGVIRHVGVVANHPQGGLSLVHTNQEAGKVTEARIDGKWLDRRIRRVYRPEFPA